ncbi:MAG: hypothetical protein V9E85_14980 [Candidatus Nanopelagicales bacterium]
MDPQTYAQTLQTWQGLWVLVGEVGATLSGLLFVAVSFNLRTIMSAERPELRTSAFRTFSQFVLLIEIAIAFQIPQEDPFALGMAVVFFAVVALITNWLSSKGGRARWSKENILLGFGLFSAVGIIGVILAAGLQAGFPLLVMMAFFTLISAVTSAWQLLLDVGVDEVDTART